MTQPSLPFNAPPQVGAPQSAPPAAADLTSSAVAVSSSPIEPNEMLAEIESELGWRAGVYARRVAEGKMTQADADRKIAIMQRVKLSIATLRDHGEFLRGCIKWRTELEPCIDVLEGRG